VSTVKRSNQQVIPTTCQSCHCECGVLVEVKDGRVVSVKGDPDHPLSKGFTCPKGRAAGDLVYHPDRIKYPLKRVGDKGSGRWQRISWGEALDTISGEFKKVIEREGPLALCVALGTGPHGYEFHGNQLWLALGCNGFSQGWICYSPSIAAGRLTYGMGNIQERGPDYESTNCMLLWATNTPTTHPPFGAKIMDARKRGAKLIVVDPRRTQLAAEADIWLQLRPGTDTALALGMLNVIVNEGLYDKDFVDRWCVGFDKLKEHVQQYPPERVADITWVPAKNIVDAARLYARTKPATLRHRVSIEHHVNSFQTLRALYILIAVTGNVGIKGGNLEPQYPRGFCDWTGLLVREDLKPPKRQLKRLGADEFPLFCGPDSLFRPMSHPPTVIKAILTGDPYPVRGLLTFSNLAVNLPNSPRVWEALHKLQFMVTVDFFLTPTAELSDIVLPPAHWLEKEEVASSSYENFIAVRQKVIEPLGECWDDKKILIELAKRLGISRWFPGSTVAEFNDYLLKSLGISFEDLKKGKYIIGPISYRKYEKQGFDTPSGKVEIYSSKMKRYGLDPLPSFHENPETPVSVPEIAAKYPFILITGMRHLSYFHSEGRQIPTLRKTCPDPIMEMHPATASQLGIADGDWVWIETPRGRIRQRAKLFEGIHPKVISAQHHWWFPEKAAPEHGCFESNTNVLTSDEPPYDRVYGGVVFRGLLCKVYK